MVHLVNGSKWLASSFHLVAWEQQGKGVQRAPFLIRGRRPRWTRPSQVSELFGGVKVGQCSCTLSLLSHMGTISHTEVTRKSMGSRCPKRVMYVNCLIYTPGSILFTKQELTCCDMSFPFHLVKASPKFIQSWLLRTSSFRSNISWPNVVLVWGVKKLMGLTTC